MRNLLFTGILVFISFFSSAQISQPDVWLKSEKIKQTVWPDLSSFSNHAVCDKPIQIDTAGLNYNDALYLDGETILKIPHDIETKANITIISVIHTADTLERGIWGTELPGNRLAGQTTRRTLGPNAHVDLYENCANKPVINRIVQMWGPLVPKETDSAHLSLGNFCGNTDSIAAFKGRIAELLIFDHMLQDLEEHQYETYLALKYGITLERGNYISSTKKILWDRQADSLYSFSITGIGRDDQIGLRQKQSTNTSDTQPLSIALGEHAPSNSENVNPLQNNNFILWGDNHQNFATDASTQSVIPVLNRKWKINISGNTISQSKTQLRLDLKQLPADTAVWYLVIDRTGSGNFDPSKTDYIQYDSLTSDSIAVFSGIQWDKDHSGSDIFSFGTSEPLKITDTVTQQPTCSDLSGGIIDIQLTGGHGPFQYTLTSSATGDQKQWKSDANTTKNKLTGGTYTLQVTDIIGTQALRQITLIKPDSFSIDLGKDRDILPGNTITLSIDRQIPDTLIAAYAWKGSKNFQSEESSIEVSETGTYNLEITTTDGCTYSDDVTLKTNLLKFFVSPKLAVMGSDKINIHVTLEQPEPVEISIVHTRGHEIFKEQLSGKRKINLSETVVEAGVYYVTLTTNSGILVEKIVVVR